jgi:excisionase family DNA binding protein
MMPDKTLTGTSAPLACLPTGESSARGGKVTPAADTTLPTGPYVTVAEAAVLLRVCAKSVRNRIKGGELEAFRHGRRILIPLTAIERLIRGGRM